MVVDERIERAEEYLMLVNIEGLLIKGKRRLELRPRNVKNLRLSRLIG